MKKLLLALIIIGVALFYFFKNDGGEINTTNPSGQTGSFQPDPSSTSFIFDDGTITLSGGKSENEETGEEISLLEERAFGDINSDKKNDAVVFLARSGGGSGVFIYAAAYVSGPVNYKGSNAVFLGDRIAPQTISVNNGTVTVYYLDRGEDEPFASEPTVPTSKQFIYQNGALEEK